MNQYSLLRTFTYFTRNNIN